jgi:hypothetical protein
VHGEGGQDENPAWAQVVLFTPDGREVESLVCEESVFGDSRFYSESKEGTSYLLTVRSETSVAGVMEDPDYHP